MKLEFSGDCQYCMDLIKYILERDTELRVDFDTMCPEPNPTFRMVE